jgi:hypothetical protein
MTAPITSTPNSAVPELPSSARLLRSTILALVGAIVILVIAVLPAEYGVDPTGVGRVLGLTQMGEIKMSLAREAAAEDAAAAAEAAAEASTPVDPSAPASALASPTAPATTAAPATMTAADTGWRDVTVVPLAPGEGKEVKLVMTKGTKAQYEWAVTGGAVNHDTHGDSTNAPNSYHRYSRGTGVAHDAGELIAAMDGSHGWFWRNRGNDPVSVTLRTKGEYTLLKKMY